MTAAPSHTVGDRIAAMYGPALWTIAGFVLFVLGGLGSLLAIAWLEHVIVGPLLLAPLAIDTGAGTPGLSVRNGLHATIWGLVVAAAAVPLGRRLVPGVRFDLSGWAALVAGLLLATAVTMLGEEFVRARFGMFDPEYQGLTLFAGPALVGIALATWAALAVPGEGVLAPGAAALTAVAGFAMTLLPSIPGAANGISGESLPLVGAFLFAIAYAALAALIVIRRFAKARH